MWHIQDSIITLSNHNQYLTFYKNQVKNPERFCRNVNQFDSQIDFVSCDILELKDGRFFEQYSKPLRLAEEIIGTVWSFRDITESQQAKEENRRIIQQEKQLAEDRAYFTSMIFHEFRNPLNIISYSTSLLKRHSHHWSEEKKLQCLQNLQTAVEQINQFTDEVLIIESVEAGKLQYELKPIDLNLFCREVLAEMSLYTKGASQFLLFQNK
ncbi:sensor histidine kinase [Nostoc punctiforme]|uniref:sensor histidine kinase n=1 Tax=Nostoc punctiforme TaxID=272131 RepID=UPI000323A384|nr:histidine kinase dimerization/phospho-acceptor domain-containing protein [Nostoc punctiforme]